MFTFHKETSAVVQAAITTSYRTGARVRVWLGDTATGAAWTSEFDVLGYIGRSMGPVKIPLLIHNRRSMGGGGLLDHCIVRIDTTDGQTLYKHPEFSTGIWLARSNGEVLYNGELHARFKSEKAANRYIDFMLGNRYSK